MTAAQGGLGGESSGDPLEGRVGVQAGEELHLRTARATARVQRKAHSEPGMKEGEEPKDSELCRTRKWKSIYGGRGWEQKELWSVV